MDLIIGGGTYGKLALDKIRDGGETVVVVDEDPNCIVQKDYRLPEISGDDKLPKGVFFIEGGIETAAAIFSGSFGINDLQGYMQGRIFPTAPVHISAGIISGLCGFVPDQNGADIAFDIIPEDLIIGRKDADIFCSLNREKPCLPRCSSPKVCPVTGERRDTPLWETLRNALYEDKNSLSIVIESRQLDAGLGYIDSSDLTRAIEAACMEDTILVCTACTCHGVVTALKKA